MSQSEIVIFRTFLNHFEADIARMVLEAAGIETFLRSDDCGGTCPHLWMGGVSLPLHLDDVKRAEEVLGNEFINPHGSTIWQAPLEPDPD
jgi:hypothetical protein